MFDRSRRGSGPTQDTPVDDELERDRFTPPAGSDAPSPSVARVREAAIIGPSIHIDGDLRGEEDLIIEGTVTGTVHLKDNSLTVGPNGKVRADVYAHSVFVDGTVEGDLYGSERIAIRKTGNVRGNVISPRVGLDDGAKFKGRIEMDQQQVDAAFGRPRGAAPKAAPESGSRPTAGGEPAKPAAAASAESKTGSTPADKPQGGAATKTGSAG